MGWNPQGDLREKEVFLDRISATVRVLGSDRRLVFFFLSLLREGSELRGSTRGCLVSTETGGDAVSVTFFNYF